MLQQIWNWTVSPDAATDSLRRFSSLMSAATTMMAVSPLMEPSMVSMATRVCMPILVNWTLMNIFTPQSVPHPFQVKLVVSIAVPRIFPAGSVEVNDVVPV